MALLLFGFSTRMELFVIVLPVLWPILVGTISGVMAVPSKLYDVGHTLRLSRVQIIRKISLPAAAPIIFIGAKIARLTLALVLAIIAEMVGNPEGLGYAIRQRATGTAAGRNVRLHIHCRHHRCRDQPDRRFCEPMGASSCDASLMSLSVSATQVLSAARSALPSIRGVIPLALLLILWQVIQSGPSPFFPAPSTWFGAIAAIPRATLHEAIAATLGSFLAAMGLATLLGGALGILVGYFDTARRALNPVLEFMRSLPPPTIVPIAVLLIGYQESMKLTVITLSALWPILLNASAAVRSLNKLMLDVSATLRLSSWQTIMKIVAPSAIPGLLIGVRIAIPLALVVALLVEMLTSIAGLGSLIIQAQRKLNAAQVYGLLTLIGVLGFLFNLLFEIIASVVLLRWPPRVQHEN